ncbi:helix-turn-helix domain-containing protein [Aminicella lysinilytica]|uniref:Excisionase family DNA binding protein n=1 Tax=Aminicella lysinilytica TaxID=433323 RepID=A0A4R6QCF2_9FIRM|nr:helix-turn-helix domain-containing protein [Aminicella lysinilytica]TDP59817.1 excisionase family DNA binding protein [Aminicella lysinilytica]
MKNNLKLNEKFIMTPEEAAEYTNTGTDVIRNLCISGQIKATKCGINWKIPRINVEQFFLDKAETGDPIR